MMASVVIADTDASTATKLQLETGDQWVPPTLRSRGSTAHVTQPWFALCKKSYLVHEDTAMSNWLAFEHYSEVNAL